MLINFLNPVLLKSLQWACLWEKNFTFLSKIRLLAVKTKYLFCSKLGMKGDVLICHFYFFVVGPPIIVEHLQKASYLVPQEKFTVCTADLALY